MKSTIRVFGHYGVEVNTYGTNPNLRDSDRDGFDDLFEISTGFNPISDQSTPDTLSKIHPAVEFEFNAAIGGGYRVEAAPDLEGSWETIESGIPGNGGVIYRLYSIQGRPHRYFRARRE